MPVEPTHLQNFSSKALGEQRAILVDVKNEKAGSEKVSPEKLFLGRLSEISLNADKGGETITKTQAAWDRVFNPSGFGQTDKTAADAESTLCMAAKIYGEKG